MVICPVAIVAGCRKCPVNALCPLKTVLGDAPKQPPAPPNASSAKPRAAARKKK